MGQAPIIFLDIDGVLNTAKGKNYWRHTPRTKTYEFNADFCPDAIRNLNDLVREFGAKIVISSYWRAFFSLETLRIIFNQYEIEGEVLDIIPLAEELSPRPERGSLISLWLARNESYRRFVIIDDNDSGISTRFPEHFVLVDESEGLADRDQVDRVRQVLAAQSQPKT